MPVKKKPRGKTPKKKKTPKKGSGLYQTIANKLTGSKLGKREIHAPQIVKGKLKMGSYIGPGTDIYKNIRRGKKPISITDEASQAHDLRYDKATTAKEVRDADLKMVNKLKKIRKSGKDNIFNTTMGIAPIRLKMWAEDKGIIKKGAFGNINKGVEAQNKNVNAREIRRLEMAGYGRGKSPKKGGCKKCKNQWLTHVKSVKSKNPGMKYSEVLQLASKSYKRIESD